MESWALPETAHGEVREPRTALAPVDAERLEPLLEAGCEEPRPAALVLAHEHGDAAGLAVPDRGEPELLVDGARGRPERVEDAREVARRAVAEEGEREVQVRPGDDAHALELVLLPRLDGVERVIGQA